MIHLHSIEQKKLLNEPMISLDEKYFGFTKKCLMETTYRFGEPAISESSRFILANPEQEVKNVHSFKTDAETLLDFIPTQGREDLAEIQQHVGDSTEDESPKDEL